MEIPTYSQYFVGGALLVEPLRLDLYITVILVQCFYHATLTLSGELLLFPLTGRQSEKETQEAVLFTDLWDCS